MSIVSLMQPTRQQLSAAEAEVDAYEAFQTAMWNLKFPNYLVLQYELPAPGFTFRVADAPATDLDGALDYIARWHAATSSALGRSHRTTELAYSTDGTRVACLDYQTITLTSPVILPNGQIYPLLPERPTRTLHLRSAHYLRLEGNRIAEWRIASDIKDFYQFLD